MFQAVSFADLARPGGQAHSNRTINVSAEHCRWQAIKLSDNCPRVL